MATEGLSLVGFMPEEQAIRYLGTRCLPADPAVQALQAQWNAAQAQLGPAFQNPGQSAVADIPPENDEHLQQLQVLPWIAPEIQVGWVFKLVEIDPLLAFQHEVDLSRSDQLCDGLPEEPSLADILPRCLRLDFPVPPFMVAKNGDHSVLIKSPSTDLRIVARGQNPELFNVFGIALGWASPLVRVVRHNNRCYLVNGFHRTVGLRRKNVKRIPCIFREVDNFADIPVKGGEETFGKELLESDAPPTLGHFAHSRAYSVQLRKVSHVINVHWSEYFLGED